MLSRFRVFSRSTLKHLDHNRKLSRTSARKMCTFGELTPYGKPQWAGVLTNAPTTKVELAHLPTPVHRWHLPGLPEDVQLFIKRDDLTGSTLSGNKVRKLEFLFADALRKGCRHVITCGGLQSNHCRAVAMAAAQLGIQCHLVLRTHVTSADGIGSDGNVFLDKMSSANIYLVPIKSPYETELLPRMKSLASKIRNESGEESYLMEVGGSSDVGFYGYLNCFQEMLSQGVQDTVDDVAFACGSGGTAEGLAVANYLTAAGLRIHPIAVCDDAAYFHRHGDSILAQLGVTGVNMCDLVDIVEDAKGLGYGVSTQDELDFIQKICQTTGILLDPVYTGKAVKSLVRELSRNPHRFKGRRILFIHTGGAFGAMDGRLANTADDAVRNRTWFWQDKESVPCSC